MKVRKRKLNYNLIFTVILSFIIGLFIFFIPPLSQLISTVLILLIGVLCYAIGKFFFQRKISLIISIFIFLTLFLLSLKLLDPVNFILLLSLFIGVFTLLK
ncbi:hypothetical protein A3A46_00375 [Candidatus Roizmanbacteria bacterium RIFCSPLOWO2_01_FULL_37_13]|uniref:Uncharacterized protein n=1 Tax=Candidatus Roizmanbacteria bacterium RIFCSPHIGHO2_02_FULL_38_11 TaxID=1802039 RepID=A0A1F7GYB4_9BACT|nr:MAG: hypothetical protein A3C25_06555 [Candidatus Roizmanbacteria bacterium RIFCSPHIGHO2_02_FULL_38_11]OGK34169.1 MAG: hypothetical protein A3F58_02045 [Candidatus Roizmanbacteria bacterium RIFCSPHIGHO2_12_FULL_37_9b]OGK42349.1 MAG: hypothetical protein A3A46_00375 [Candidatus Roizmanbacteria bacterium RIFCSPLOWO2_01_FULL_37_13]